MIRYLILCLLTLVLSDIQAQTRKFDIIAMDKIVGEAVSIKTPISENKYRIDYSFEAEIKVLFIKTTVDLKIDIIYENNQIIEADVIYTYNGKPYKRNYLWDNEKYIVTTDGETSSQTQKAFFSVMNFYVKEPADVSKVFLEKQNEFVKLENLGNHNYKLNVDGDDCTYTYKNGELQKLVVESFVKLTLVRK